MASGHGDEGDPRGEHVEASLLLSSPLLWWWWCLLWQQ
jgi:hypothetical protein